MKNKVNEEVNAKIVALFLFQYSILMPVMYSASPTLVVAVCSLTLLAVAAYVNRLRGINIYSIIFLFFIFIIVLLKMLFAEEKSGDILFSCITIVAPSILICSVKFDFQYFKKYGQSLAKVNFLIIALIPFASVYEYMRFGYGMLLTLIFLYYQVSDKNYKNKFEKVVVLIIFVVSLIELILYGARGAFFSFLLFCALDLFFVGRKHLLRNIAILGTASLMMYKANSLLAFMELIAKKVGLPSYALAKYRMAIEYDMVTASSGRGTLYANAVEKIKDHPIWGGDLMIGSDDGAYVHNIFLQIALDFGILGLIVLFIFTIVLGWILVSKKIEINVKRIATILVAIALGRLMVSSTYWLRPEFWMLIGSVLLIIKNQKYGDRGENQF